jgi:2-succinyl-5-enolpyruvyl-6-hydroxy-3-cyclohexene-1-carboxylate synthase
MPQVDYEDVFEPYFATPHGLTFKAAAELYELDYCLADNWEKFREAVEISLVGNKTTVIEVPGDRKLNVMLHQQIRNAVVSQIHQNDGARDD